VTGYHKSKCSSKLVAQIIRPTKISSKQYGDKQMRERDRHRDEISQKVAGSETCDLLSCKPML